MLFTELTQAHAGHGLYRAYAFSLLAGAVSLGTLRGEGGRRFEEEDTTSGPPQCLVNEASIVIETDHVKGNGHVIKVSDAATEKLVRRESELCGA